MPVASPNTRWRRRRWTAAPIPSAQAHRNDPWRTARGIAVRQARRHPLHVHRPARVARNTRSTLDPTIALNTGDHVAIEVEVSDPAKTAPSNAEKNAAAGVRLTLISVLPGPHERTSEALTHLAPELRATTIV